MERKHYLIKRICGYLLTIFLILVFNFVLIRIMPGDPMMYILGEEDYYDFFYNNPSYLEKLREVYDLNGSVIHQFWIYMKDIVHLNFGTSYHYGRPVLELILFRASWTLRLVIPAILISAVLGIVGGLPAGWHWGKKREQCSTLFATVLHTIPTYCLSIILLSIFSYQLGWFPQGNMVSDRKSVV